MARVLIIDDEEIIRYTFSEGLRDFGHEVKLGSTIDQAMDIVENSTLDYALSISSLQVNLA